MITKKIVFTGSGGQGIITAAIILAEAAVIYNDLYAVQSQSYGPEARGGSTRSDVIISDSVINYPKISSANMLVCLSQEAFSKYSSTVEPGGLIITDSKFVFVRSAYDANIKELPIFDTLVERLANPICCNLAVLGAVLHHIKIVKKEAVIAVLKTRMNEKFIPLNIAALDLGIELSTTQS